MESRGEGEGQGDSKGGGTRSTFKRLPLARNRPSVVAVAPFTGQHRHSCWAAHSRENLEASEHFLYALLELETCPGTGSSGEPQGTTNDWMPGRKEPGSSEGAATEEPRGTGLTVTPPMSNLLAGTPGAAGLGPGQPKMASVGP